MGKRASDHTSTITAEDLQRIQTLLKTVGGKAVHWGASSALEVWLAEARMESDRQAAQRLLWATWALVVATVALVFATVGLIVTAV